MSIPDAVAPPAAKFEFWRSMADLGRLVLRTGTRGLKVRLVLALALVLLGKWTGVSAPIWIGRAIDTLGHGRGAGAILFAIFAGLAGWHEVERATSARAAAARCQTLAGH